MLDLIGIYVPTSQLSKFREKLGALGITTFNWDNRPVVVVILTYKYTVQFSEIWYINNSKNPDEEINLCKTEEEFLNQITLHLLGVTK